MKTYLCLFSKFRKTRSRDIIAIFNYLKINKMKKLFLIPILLFIIYSCSKDEETQAPTNSVQTTTPEPETVVVQYTLTVSAADGGSVSDGGTFDEGTDVTITATPNEGYRFTGWEGNSSSSESLTITLNSNQTYQAIFELIPIYTLTVTTGEGGTVSTEGGTYDEGTEVTISASANQGYIFNGWEGSNSPEKSLTISLNSNVSLIANFRIMNTTDLNNDPDIFNYDTNIDYTEQIVDFYPNAFFASDLSENVINGVNLALKTAADEFGKYGPVEYWVMGTNTEAGNVLLNEFCERREVLGQWDLADCLSSENNESRGGSMSSYISLGESLVSENRPISSAAHTGGFQWGIHKLSSSYPHSLDNYFDYIPYLEQFKVVIHEYFHVVQHASIYNIDVGLKNEILKPGGAIWMMEGGAEYMAVYALFKKIADGTLNFNDSQLKNYESLRTVMSDNMSLGKSLILESNYPDMKLQEISYQTYSQPVYHIGPWAVAYLTNKVNNQNVLWDTFYPNLKELGFEGAFNLAFGYTTEEFYEEFDTFLQLPIEEQLEIIPDI